jgi:hypothetical protein
MIFIAIPTDEEVKINYAGFKIIINKFKQKNDRLRLGRVYLCGLKFIQSRGD